MKGVVRRCKANGANAEGGKLGTVVLQRRNGRDRSCEKYFPAVTDPSSRFQVLQLPQFELSRAGNWERGKAEAESG